MTSLLHLLIPVAVIISTASCGGFVDPCASVVCEACIEPCACKGSQDAVMLSVNESSISEDFAVNASEKAIEASLESKKIIELTSELCHHLSVEIINHKSHVDKLKKVMSNVEKVLKNHKKRPVCRPSIAKAMGFIRQSSEEITASMSGVKVFANALANLKTHIAVANKASVEAFASTLVAAKASANASATALASAKALIVADCDNATITAKLHAEAAVEAEAEVEFHYERAVVAYSEAASNFVAFSKSSQWLRERLTINMTIMPDFKELQVMDALGQKCDKIYQ